MLARCSACSAMYSHACSPNMGSFHFLVKVATSTPPSFNLPFSANAFACMASRALSFSSRDMSVVGFSVILSAGIAGCCFGASAALLGGTCSWHDFSQPCQTMLRSCTLRAAVSAEHWCKINFHEDTSACTSASMYAGRRPWQEDITVLHICLMRCVSKPEHTL